MKKETLFLAGKKNRIYYLLQARHAARPGRGHLIINSIGIFVFILSICGCATNPVTGRSELMLVSEQQEIAMGRQAVPSLNWGFGGEYRDRLLEDYLNGIVMRIWSVSERPGLPVSFRIQNTSLPNAFALPGYVAMTRGLLVELENEAQFAAIMGHEAGHVMARHSAGRMSLGILQQVGLGVGGAFLGDGLGGDALMTLGSVSASLLLLKYDRTQELEADRLGVIYASKLGYDPYESITAHQRLGISVDKYMDRAGKDSQSGGFLSDILSTHPRKDVRVEEIQQMIRQLPPYSLKGDGKASEDFMSMTSRIRKVHEAYVVYDDAEKALEKRNYEEAGRLAGKAIGMDSQQAPFYALQGRISLALKNYDDGIVYFRKALSVDSSYQPAFYGIGVGEYKKEKPAAALEHLKKSLELFPDHPGSLYVSGLCYHDMGRPQDALGYFGKFIEIIDRHPEVYGYIGINSEKISKKDQAIAAYKAQIKVAPDNSMGQYARQRLAVLNR